MRRPLFRCSAAARNRAAARDMPFAAESAPGQGSPTALQLSVRPEDWQRPLDPGQGAVCLEI